MAESRACSTARFSSIAFELSLSTYDACNALWLRYARLFTVHWVLTSIRWTVQSILSQIGLPGEIVEVVVWSTRLVWRHVEVRRQVEVLGENQSSEAQKVRYSDTI